MLGTCRFSGSAHTGFYAATVEMAHRTISIILYRYFRIVPSNFLLVNIYWKKLGIANIFGIFHKNREPQHFSKCRGLCILFD